MRRRNGKNAKFEIATGKQQRRSANFTLLLLVRHHILEELPDCAPWTCESIRRVFTLMFTLVFVVPPLSVCEFSDLTQELSSCQLAGVALLPQCEHDHARLLFHANEHLLKLEPHPQPPLSQINALRHSCAFPHLMRIGWKLLRGEAMFDDQGRHRQELHTLPNLTRRTYFFSSQK